MCLKVAIMLTHVHFVYKCNSIGGQALQVLTTFAPAAAPTPPTPPPTPHPRRVAGRSRGLPGARERPDAWGRGRVPQAHLPHGDPEAAGCPLHRGRGHRDHPHRAGMYVGDGKKFAGPPGVAVRLLAFFSAPAPGGVCFSQVFKSLFLSG